MYRTIMVPLDGSSFGEHALPLALSLARQSNAHLHLVHSHVAIAGREEDPARDLQRRDNEHAYLSAVAERIAASWHGSIETAVRESPVAESIAAYAEDQSIDLTVMTTHGRGALSRAWLGSVAHQLIHRLRMPMLLVRPHETEGADIDNPPGINRVLIPLDGSQFSESIIPRALDLGRLSGAGYSLLRVIELPMTDWGNGVATLTAINIDAWIEEGEQYLKRLAAPLQAEGLQVTTAVTVGWPAQTILDYARDHAIDLIVLATHGRSGAARLLLGSVADKVVRGAAVPVLLQRPPSEPAAPSLL
jgi:nucleotide-binding universal stress UspA family protein